MKPAVPSDRNRGSPAKHQTVKLWPRYIPRDAPMDAVPTPCSPSSLVVATLRTYHETVQRSRDFRRLAASQSGRTSSPRFEWTGLFMHQLAIRATGRDSKCNAHWEWSAYRSLPTPSCHLHPYPHPLYTDSTTSRLDRTSFVRTIPSTARCQRLPRQLSLLRPKPTRRTSEGLHR
jgi:hypothetical protein